MREVSKQLLGTTITFRDTASDAIVSPDSTRWAYLETLSTNKSFVVVNGKKGRVYDETRNPGFSPDSKRLAYVARLGDKHFVVVDGKESKAYDSINMLTDIFGASLSSAKPGPSFDVATSASNIFSLDSQRLAYVAYSGGKYFVVTDSQEGQAFDSIRSAGAIFSPNSKHIAYRGKSDNKWVVVTDGKPSKPYSEIAQASLIFSPDSQRVAYIAYSGDTKFVVVDGKEGPSTMDEPIFSPDGKHFAYLHYSDGETSLVVNGKISKVDDGARNLKYSPDSKRLAYVVGRDFEKKSVMVDKEKGKAYDHLKFQPLFSPDSMRVAYLATSNGKKFVVVDGKEGKKYDILNGNYDTVVVFSPDSKRVAYRVTTGRKPTNDRLDEPVLDRKQFIVVDDKEGKTYDDIPTQSPIFSPDGLRVAYLAKSGNKQFVVVDGKEGKAYDHLDHLVFSPDSKYLAYVAYFGEKCVVVVNGTESSAYTNFLHGSKIVFDSPDSLHYLAMIEQSVYLVQEKLKRK